MIWNSIECRLKAVFCFGIFIAAAVVVDAAAVAACLHPMNVKHVYFSYGGNIFLGASWFWVCVSSLRSFPLSHLSYLHIQQGKICEFIVHVAVAKTERTFVLHIYLFTLLTLSPSISMRNEGGKKYENMTLPKRAFRVFTIKLRIWKTHFIDFPFKWSSAPFRVVCAVVFKIDL